MDWIVGEEFSDEPNADIWWNRLAHETKSVLGDLKPIRLTKIAATNVTNLTAEYERARFEIAQGSTDEYARFVSLLENLEVEFSFLVGQFIEGYFFEFPAQEDPYALLQRAHLQRIRFLAYYMSAFNRTIRWRATCYALLAGMLKTKYGEFFAKPAQALNKIAARLEDENAANFSFTVWDSRIRHIKHNDFTWLWHNRVIVDYNVLADASNTVSRPDRQIKLKKKEIPKNNSSTETFATTLSKMSSEPLVIQDPVDGSAVVVEQSTVPAAPETVGTGIIGTARNWVSNVTSFISGKPVVRNVLVGAGATAAAAAAAGGAYLYNAAGQAVPVATSFAQQGLNVASPYIDQAAAFAAPYANQAVEFAAPYAAQAVSLGSQAVASAGEVLASIDPTTAAVIGTGTLAGIAGLVAVKKRYFSAAEKKQIVDELEKATNRLEKRATNTINRESRRTNNARKTNSLANAQVAVETVADAARRSIDKLKKSGNGPAAAVAAQQAAAEVLQLAKATSIVERHSQADRIPIAAVTQPSSVVFVEPAAILPAANLGLLSDRLSQRASRSHHAAEPKAKPKPTRRNTTSPAKKPAAARARSPSPSKTITIRGQRVRSPPKRGAAASKSGTAKKTPARRTPAKTATTRRALSTTKRLPRARRAVSPSPRGRARK